MKVHLIRHGQTVLNLAGISQDASTPIIRDPSIDWNMYSYLMPQKIIVSPYVRTLETASLLFPNHPVEVLPYIHEFKAPSLVVGMEHAKKMAFWAKHMPDLRTDPDWKFDGSESFNDVKARVKMLYAYLHPQNLQSIIVVSHGNFMRNFLGYLKYKDAYSWAHYESEYMPMVWKNLQLIEQSINE